MSQCHNGGKEGDLREWGIYVLLRKGDLRVQFIGTKDLASYRGCIERDRERWDNPGRGEPRAGV